MRRARPPPYTVEDNKIVQPRARPVVGRARRDHEGSAGSGA